MSLSVSLDLCKTLLACWKRGQDINFRSVHGGSDIEWSKAYFIQIFCTSQMRTKHTALSRLRFFAVDEQVLLNLQIWNIFHGLRQWNIIKNIIDIETLLGNSSTITMYLVQPMEMIGIIYRRSHFTKRAVKWSKHLRIPYLAVIIYSTNRCEDATESDSFNSVAK